MGGTVIMVAVLVVAMYFLMIRPAKRQQQAQQKLMDSLAVGSRVMLNSGIYCTIRHLGDKQAIVEISPGVDLTIARRAVTKVATPEEEEFEYAEATDAMEAANASATASDIALPEDWPVLDEAPAVDSVDAPGDPDTPLEADQSGAESDR
jgi:preprotein translocase subunit YajC